MASTLVSMASNLLAMGRERETPEIAGAPRSPMELACWQVLWVGEVCRGLKKDTTARKTLGHCTYFI